MDLFQKMHLEVSLKHTGIKQELYSGPVQDTHANQLQQDISQLQMICKLPLHEKPHFFPRRPEKMVFPKNLRWNMVFLALSGKMIFLFPENTILHLRWKMKDDLS